MAFAKVSLDDKYDLTKSRVYISGMQAIIRMALMQHELDKRQGLNTAGYITGYRGSPIGSLDQQLMGIPHLLKAHNIVFQSGLNEDLAATALWGSQQAELRGEGRYDGVFGIWYGKGPGVDRSGDIFRHANHAGTSKHGGVLALMGDDHTCESSTSAHQSEFAFLDAMMPVLNPAGVQEIMDFGHYGWALSRYAGVWVGLKCVKDNIEQTASVDGSLERLNIVTPSDFVMPPEGVNIRLRDEALAKEARLHDVKRLAILAFIRANKLDRLVLSGGPAPRIGIVTTGKSYLDVAEALDLIGIDEVKAADLGLRLYKVGVTWPLEPDGITAFADGLDLILVVEEKRSLIETQIKEQLYGQRNAPAVIGKRDENEDWLFPAKGALEPVQIAITLARRILAREQDPEIASRLEELEKVEAHARNASNLITRIPYFCSGCPHNSSTIVPEGARAYAGIGCHYMVQWMDRSTEGFTQMGGEGANWIGEAPFSKRDHIFQNLGDGTYMHSGSLAIRAAVVSGTNITFKLLYNDAVAMTGGQMIEGGVSVADMARQVAAEGANRVVIVSDEPEKYTTNDRFPFGTTIHHRDELQSVQKELQKVKGVSVLIYDQTCAAEKRRRRKRGLYPDPPKRVVINELVCEGCGDCGVQSNCMSIAPVTTEFGRKRTIDQSSCNKDFSCVNGFCPSFVTVHGGSLKKGLEKAQDRSVHAPETSELPEPRLPSLERPHSIIVTGVGGTGVVTIGALIGMAAHIEDKGVGIIDMAGLAQKGGAVTVHLRVGSKPEDIKAIRASVAGADLILGCDLVVTGSDKVLATVREGRTTVVANSHETMTADFTHRPDMEIPGEELKLALEARAGADKTFFIEAYRYATALLGDSIAVNLFLLGYAYQLGHIPVSSQALLEAIRLNGVAVEMNIHAFQWGRLAAHDGRALEKIVQPVVSPLPTHRLAKTLDEVISRRVAFLTDYQNAAYAERYRKRVLEAQELEKKYSPDQTLLSEAVARSYFKLLTYKDEYEVARLYTNGSFHEQLEREFEGDYRLEFHLAAPLLARKDPETGLPKKRRFGPWVMTIFRLLAGLKGLRGTWFDIFGRTQERKFERQLIADYEKFLDELPSYLNAQSFDTLLELAKLPQSIRGFGHIKMRNAIEVEQRGQSLLQALKSDSSQHPIAAE